jgi:crossover junction endodeoxyribonuclease RuvC
LKILGIDPGYAILGWSVIDSGMKLIDYGVITTDSSMLFPDRVLHVHKSITEIITLHKPDCASIEKQFFTKNVTTALNVAQTLGAVILSIRLAGIDYHEYTPLQIKQAVTGYGRATKDQMQLMMQRIFNLKELPKPDDAADGLAAAACHCLSVSAGICRRI